MMPATTPLTAPALTTETAPRWLVMVNLMGVGLGAALLIAALLISLWIAKEPPYDYAILMRSASIFCFDQPNFQYGVSVYVDGARQLSFYPAPFYTTFCLPHRYAPALLLVMWQAMPFVLLVWLSGRRAALMAYPPLFLLLLLGQSTGWLLPLYTVAAWTTRDSPIRWWHGLSLAAAIFKPHLAFPAAVYLLVRWRRRPITLAVGVAALAAISLPAFLIKPDWVIAWLPNGRGFEAENMGTVARLPVRFFDIVFAPDAPTQVLVWLFCILVAGSLLVLLAWRRGRLMFYDVFLVLCFTIPPLHDYDLVILLPFVVLSPRRLLLALTAGVGTWLYVVMTGTALNNLGYYNMSVLITLALLAERLLRVTPERSSLAALPR